jgi:hypothetical protein
MRMADGGQLERYRSAVDAIASSVALAVWSKLPEPEDVEELALGEVASIERDADSVHGWIFRDPSVLDLSEHVFEALDTRSDGRRDWLHASLASAIAAVARFDVMIEALTRIQEAGGDTEEAEPAEMGEA